MEWVKWMEWVERRGETKKVLLVEKGETPSQRPPHHPVHPLHPLHHTARTPLPQHCCVAVSAVVFRG